MIELLQNLRNLAVEKKKTTAGITTLCLILLICFSGANAWGQELREITVCGASSYQLEGFKFYTDEQCTQNERNSITQASTIYWGKKVTEFPFTGRATTYILADGSKVEMEVYGAQGASFSGHPGGLGGKST